MTISIHQPNYLPWLGYFHKLAQSDIFVIFDDVQLPTGKMFITRSLIKTQNGPLWLNVPILNKGDKILIKDALIATNNNWQKKHLKSIIFSYQKAPFFNKYIEEIEQIYNTEWLKLCDLNLSIIRLINKLLNIKTKLVLSSEISSSELLGEEKILTIIKNFRADTYLSGKGKGSMRYISPSDFEREKIKLIFQEFTHPVYSQLWGKFIPNLSIIDLIFNYGPRSLEILNNKIN
jgi:hypothetical protein